MKGESDSGKVENRCFWGSLITECQPDKLSTCKTCTQPEESIPVCHYETRESAKMEKDE